MFESIKPRRPIFGTTSVQQRCERRMRTLVADIWREAADYEVPDSPNYERTNMLKKSWSSGVHYRNGVLIGEVLSSGRVAPYNVYVRGTRRKQAKRMKARGWRSIEDIKEEYWPEAEADFKAIIKGAGK
jgi:hypothetical protein